MKSGIGFESGQWNYELQAITTAVCALAEGCQGDSMALLALLRRLEELHREIRDGIFQASLPDNRQALYALLKDIEAKGGWPYIERMKLQSLLEKLPAEAASEAGVSPAMGDGWVDSEDTEQLAPSHNSACAIEKQASGGGKNHDSD